MSLHLEFDDEARPGPGQAAQDPCLTRACRDMGDHLTYILAAAERALVSADGAVTWREDAARIEEHARVLVDTVRRFQGLTPAEADPAPSAPAAPQVPATEVRPLVIRGAGPDPSQPRPLVLVVADQPAMCDLLARTLTDRYDVALAGSAAAGLELADELAPDLVVAEAALPDADAERLLGALRARPALDATPVALLTAEADVLERMRLLQLGAQDVLVKPFAPLDAVRRIGALIAHRPEPRHEHVDVLARTWSEDALRAAIEDALLAAAGRGDGVALAITRVVATAGADRSAGGEAAEGDRRLATLAAAVQRHTRAGDLVARVEGRQLVVVVARPDGARAAEAAAALVRAAGHGDPPTAEGTFVAVDPTQSTGGRALRRARAALAASGVGHRAGGRSLRPALGAAGRAARSVA